MPVRRWLVALIALGLIRPVFDPLLTKEGVGGGRTTAAFATSPGPSLVRRGTILHAASWPAVGGSLGNLAQAIGADDRQTREAGDTHPLRVISLAPSVTEILFALGAGNEVVGVSTYCDYPPEATTIKRVGTFLTPNVEEIVALRPDVIIGVPTPGNEGPVRSLQGLGLRVVIVGGDTMRQIRESIDGIAQVIGRAEAGRALLARLDARLVAVQARVHNAPVRRVLMVVGQKPLVAVGTGTFQDELIRMAGGFNVAGGTGLTWPHVNIEAVIAWAPEIIIDTSMGTEESARTLDFWKQFPSLPAVRDGRVYGFRAYQLLRPGPRIVDALDTLARSIHPERFEGTVQSPRSKVQSQKNLGCVPEGETLDLGLWTLGCSDLGPWTLDFGQCST